MKSRIERYKERRYRRILSRLDSEDEEGRWITTENGHKVHLNEEGDPDKGNPHVIEKMTDESGSAESTGGKKRRTIKDFVDLIDKYPKTIAGQVDLWRDIQGKLDEAPLGSKITIPSYEDRGGSLVKVKGGWMFEKTGGVIDADLVTELFEDEGFGKDSDDAVGITYEEPGAFGGSDRSGQNTGEKRAGRSETEKKISSLLDGSDESREKLVDELDKVPVGSVFLVRSIEGVEVDIVEKTGPNSYNRDNTYNIDEEDMAEFLEESTGEMDVITSDQFEAVTVSGKGTHDLFKVKSQRWRTVDMLSRAPVGTVIRFKPSSFQGEEETSLVREKGGIWRDTELDISYNDQEVYGYLRDCGFVPTSDETKASELVEYKEPDQKKYIAKKPEKSIIGGCKTFSDRADDGGFSFSGNGQEQVEFFEDNSNFDELLSNLSEEEEEAFESYTRGDLMKSYAHSGWDAMPSWLQTSVRAIDGVIDQATLDEGVVVSRLSNAALLLGYDNKEALLTELQAMVGKRVVSRGFMSCAAADEGLEIGQLKMVEYKIAVPGGTVGAGMWLGDERVNDWGAHQREFCLNRDTEYEVGNVYYDPKGRKYIVEMKFIRRLEHDYGKD